MEERKAPDPVYQHPSGIEIYEKIWHNAQGTIDAVEKECADPNSPMKWERASVQGYGYDNAVDDIRTNEHLGITKYAEEGIQTAQFLHNNLADMFEAITQSYMYRHRILGAEHTHESYMMLKYTDGQYFESHVDSMPGSDRFITAIMYLNDDYEGGELEFTNLELKIKMPKESLIVFPSYFPYAHKAYPVTSGTKYSIVAWLKTIKD